MNPSKAFLEDHTTSKLRAVAPLVLFAIGLVAVLLVVVAPDSDHGNPVLLVIALSAVITGGVWSICSFHSEIEKAASRRGEVFSAMQGAVSERYSLELKGTDLIDSNPGGRSTPTPSLFEMADGSRTRYLLSFEASTGAPVMADMIESLVPVESLLRDDE